MLPQYGSEGGPTAASTSSLLSSLHTTFTSIISATPSDSMRARFVNPVDKGDATKDINYAEVRMAFDTLDANYNPFAQNIPNFAARFGIAKKIKRVEYKSDVLNHYKSDKNMV